MQCFLEDFCIDTGDGLGVCFGTALLWVSEESAGDWDIDLDMMDNISEMLLDEARREDRQVKVRGTTPDGVRVEGRVTVEAITADGSRPASATLKGAGPLLTMKAS